ncbi:YicC family protein [Halomonas sp. KAO]|uniref:YicC/YloC family endoribonuclease n=1 Tax=unclassified Halomonas TaxID=2609666 RepID=UPI00189E6F6E|nr:MULTISPECIES: YicC/YloC family endoribonuclease [unclassified Halomonas]MBF7053607.1 YicC family protein [Halomonas sp. KAO]MDT0500886.1 YicC/YloC family endoribonuclease [Halomonas sp. PAR7]MDT0512622.1 YicC/YloC family endoribonuclease [Halomonas sp. LES1]MDT0592796.1 YicC/YloC family endoribonuclease [Halomonas sp. PAR8]
MVHSMTAFARQEHTAAWGSLQLELRSVNQRYLEPHFRLPESLRDLEPAFRDALRARLARGKIEVSLRFEAAGDGAGLAVNPARLAELGRALGEVRQVVTEATPPDALALLDYPGVLENRGPDPETVKSAALALFERALVDLLAGRAREGGKLAELIRERLACIETQVTEVRGLMPRILERQRAQLLERLETVMAELDPQRLEAELTLLAQKADVDEELDRLVTHVAEVKRQLDQKGPVGRRLDFLMQELNREANTLSSKSVVASTTRCAVELKVLIEQIREQVQNIE